MTKDEAMRLAVELTKSVCVSTDKVIWTQPDIKAMLDSTFKYISDKCFDPNPFQ